MNDDLLSLLPQVELNRRDFVVTTLAAGFALSVQPVSADTITTDTKGLDAGEVKIPVADGTIPAYQAKPSSGGPFPTVLVVQEIFGVHEHIKDVCRRFAKLGYLAIAPELFARQGDVSKITDMRKIVGEVVSKVPDAQVMSDLDATVAWAKATGGGDTGKLAITGFCWGGRIVWLYSAHNPNLKAGVAWYGRLVGEKTALQPEAPDRRGRPTSTPRCSGSTAPTTPGSRGHRRPDEDSPRRRQEAVRVRRLPRHPARLPRRLPPELPRRARRRRLEAPPRLVQGQRRRLNPQDPGRGADSPPGQGPSLVGLDHEVLEANFHRLADVDLEGDDPGLGEDRVDQVDRLRPVQADGDVVPLGGDDHVVPVAVADQGFGLLLGVLFEDPGPHASSYNEPQ